MPARIHAENRDPQWGRRHGLHAGGRLPVLQQYRESGVDRDRHQVRDRNRLPRGGRARLHAPLSLLRLSRPDHAHAGRALAAATGGDVALQFRQAGHPRGQHRVGNQRAHLPRWTDPVLRYPGRGDLQLQRRAREPRHPARRRLRLPGAGCGGDLPRRRPAAEHHPDVGRNPHPHLQRRRLRRCIRASGRDSDGRGAHAESAPSRDRLLRQRALVRLQRSGQTGRDVRSFRRAHFLYLRSLRAQ